MGGAHGDIFNLSATFLLDDGQILTKSMLPQISALRPYIIKGLANYCECPVSEVGDFLNITDLEYPGSNPHITKDGLCLTYGEYEIGPLGAGTPTASIPFETARKLCTGPILKFL